MTGLKITDLHAAHGRATVLHGVDLTVDDGALACVLGPSGCGKSTLLRVVAGFHRASAGTVTVGDRILDDGDVSVRAEQRRIGYVPQHGALFPHLSVAANVGFGLRRGDRRARVAEMLELVDLVGFGDRHPHQLSGGQQQRVALARALAPRPDLLLLDEPFSALDAALRVEVRTEVADLLRRAGATAVLVTHDADEALSFADVIAVMREGRIVQDGPPPTLFHHPVDIGVARALGEANLIPAGHPVAVALGLRASHPDPGICIVRPHRFEIATGESARSAACRVLRTSFRGSDLRVELEPQSGSGQRPALVVYAPVHAGGLAPGDLVHVTMAEQPLAG